MTVDEDVGVRPTVRSTFPPFAVWGARCQVGALHLFATGAEPDSEHGKAVATWLSVPSVEATGRSRILFVIVVTHFELISHAAFGACLVTVISVYQAAPLSGWRCLAIGVNVIKLAVQWVGQPFLALAKLDLVLPTAELLNRSVIKLRMLIQCRGAKRRDIVLAGRVHGLAVLAHGRAAACPIATCHLATKLVDERPIVVALSTASCLHSAAPKSVGTDCGSSAKLAGTDVVNDHVGRRISARLRCGRWWRRRR